MCCRAAARMGAQHSVALDGDCSVKERVRCTGGAQWQRKRKRELMRSSQVNRSCCVVWLLVPMCFTHRLHSPHTILCTPCAWYALRRLCSC